MIEWVRLHHESVTGRDGYSDFYKKDITFNSLGPVGDKVEEGDILAEIETDKATMEFESFNEGTLLHRYIILIIVIIYLSNIATTHFKLS